MSHVPRKIAYTFVDGQNLYHCAKEAFNYYHPNYDIRKLVQEVCNEKDWAVGCIRFYTGVPDSKEDPFWAGFWQKKLSAMGRNGIQVTTRPIRYMDETIQLDNSTTQTVRIGTEKGIDVRIALDAVHYGLEKSYDVALIFSQDQDLSELASELKRISKRQNRWLKVACAYPVGPGTINHRGINGTDWIKINKAFYDQCIDPKDYR